MISRRALLACGVLAPLVYVAGDLLAVARWDGYSMRAQTISELMAIGAPTRPMLVVLFGAFDVLVVALGLGLWESAGPSRALRATAVVLFAYGLVGAAGLLFAPMHLRGAEGSLTDVLHIAATIGLVGLTLLAMVLGAVAGSRRFRAYTVATIVLLVVFGALAGLQGQAIADNTATPWLGVLERVNVYATMAWLAALSLGELRRNRRRAQDTLDDGGGETPPHGGEPLGAR